MEIRINELNPELFLELYTAVGWEPPCRQQVEKALENSFATFVAYDADTAVGMVRLIGDGGMSFYIKDFAVLPACQGKGVGKRLLEAVENYIRQQIDRNWAVCLELISTLQAQNFYEKMGFEVRPCAWDGPGMLKMIR